MIQNCVCMIWKVSRRSGKFPYYLKSVQIIQNLQPDYPEVVCFSKKVLQNHPLCAFVANLKIDAIYALYPESFCDKNLATRKVFAFCDCASQVSLPADHISLHFLSLTGNASEYKLATEYFTPQGLSGLSVMSMALLWIQRQEGQNFPTKQLNLK